MRSNFDISLPSIPGKTIKFKIQDIKQTSFGSQKSRFNDNKRGLTKKFIESFNNFHQSKQQNRLEQQTQASQSNSRITGRSSNLPKKPEQKYRHVIPQDKKHMVSVYDAYKDYKVPILKQSKFDKGFTFDQAHKQITEIRNCQDQDQEDKLRRKFVTDNHYFTSNVLRSQDSRQGSNNEKVKKDAQNRRQRPSAIFKNQPRQKVWDKYYKSQVPGPGFYVIKEQVEDKNKSRRAISMKESSAPQNDFKRLKNIITSIVGQQKEMSGDALDDQQNKKQKMQYMFVQDDRDRFGQQRYPISSKVNVPGPGSYDIMKGIQEQSKKAALVQQQRKLLKQWFNN